MIPVAFLKKFAPPCFYHFTDTRNLASIKKNGGLHSLEKLRMQGIKIPCSGGNDWSHEADVRAGVDKYVHLCFMSEHPMEYVARTKEKRLLETRFLKISPTILMTEGILLTTDVSNKSGVEPLPFAAGAKIMDFEVIYSRTNWRDPEIQRRRQVAKKYELLIPESVPLDFITFS